MTLAALAPVPGTVEPGVAGCRQHEPAPMTKADWTGPDNQTAPRTLLMEHRQFGRDIYSRVLYGTRISLVVGVAVAVVALLIGASSV